MFRPPARAAVAVAVATVTVALTVNAAAAVTVGPSPPPADASIERIALPDAVARALARNPSAAVAALEIQRADALVREARAAEYPSLLGVGSYTLLDHDRTSGPTVVQDRNQWNGTLSASVPILVPLAWTGVNRA